MDLATWLCFFLLIFLALLLVGEEGVVVVDVGDGGADVEAVDIVEELE